MGQAEALAAAMTDTLATKQDLREVETRIDARFARVDARFDQVDARFVQVDARFDHLERSIDSRFTEYDKQTDLRFREQTALLRGEMADLERRMTIRLGGITVAGIGVVSALVKVL